MAEEAVKWAQNGFPVLPCNPNTKNPYLSRDKDKDGNWILNSGGLYRASINPDTIRAWWEKWPNALIGVRLGPGCGAFAVDPDRPKRPGDPDGFAAWQKLVERNGGLPPTHAHRTPHGGAHFLFKYPTDRRIACSSGSLPPGIDVRGDGGYVIAPPSILADGRAYTFEDPALAFQVAEAPAWLLDEIAPREASTRGQRRGRGEAKPAETGANVFTLAADAMGRRKGEIVPARAGFSAAYLSKALAAEIEAAASAAKGDRNDALNRAAYSLGQLVGAGALDDTDVRDRLLSAARVSGLVADDGEAAALATIESGVTKGAESPRPVPPPAGDDHGTLLDEMNEKYAVVIDGGRTRVLTFRRERVNGRSREVPTFLGIEDFKTFFANRSVSVGEDKRMSLGAWWLRHPQRRQYIGLTFDPSAAPEVDGHLNLWRGFAIKPEPGSWALIRRHIDDVVASGNAEHTQYIIRWLAWAVQNPDAPAEVALVLLGTKGAGKGTLGNIMCYIFGRHAVHISSSDHLSGKFNNHLRDTCFIFADEAYWPGDKSAEGSLKRLLTEPSLFVEAKGRDGTIVPNRLHVMMASNESWVAPAGADERRFAVFRVSEHVKQDQAYFGPLHAEIRNGGAEAMLHDLLAIDLAGWHPRQVVRTEALLEQQEQSLSPLEAWWVSLLEAGVLEGADPRHPNRAVSAGWDEKVPVGLSTRTERRRGLFDQARDISPKLKLVSDHQLGRFLRSKGCTNTLKVMRRQGWTFPPLAQLRTQWEAAYAGWQWGTAVTEWQSGAATDDEDERPNKAKPEAVQTIF
ncbi:bifunctional DNA primase/polymerase [Methylobacterium sp. WSM2598]|uniref:bifunctional DNA primase/polymerase n=1 Tax=Methylobacterium sp. WSM2598 TaxID=398261 RepID=UPI000A067436|nr:bifunctional DNA primase/polymerase [Methylobacterium sp. WSM2598]